MRKGQSGEGGGNFSNLKKIQRDDFGNVLLCPHCHSTHLIRAGNDGSTQMHLKGGSAKPVVEKLSTPS